MPEPAPATSDVTRERPLYEMLRMAAPTVATMGSYTLMQFVDAWMVSKIPPSDPVYLSAQGNGGIWAFAPNAILLGFLGVINTYVSQNLGAGKPERGPAYAWTGFWMSLVYALLLVPYAAALPWVFEKMGHAPRLVELESGYARILVYGVVLNLITRTLSQFFFGLHKPWVVFIGAICGNVTNLAINSVLIYGNDKLGVAPMGVVGAAIGTVIGSGVEALIPACVFLSGKYNRLYQTRSSWRFDAEKLKELLKLGWPPALMFGNEIICWAVFMTYLAGGFGPEHNTAGWIALRYMHMSFMPAVGFSYAMTAMVGKCMGAGRPDLAVARVRLGVATIMVYMGACALCMVLFRHQLVGVFVESNDSARSAGIIGIGASVMIVAAVFQIFDGLGIVLMGALRGAGDTVVPGVVTLVLAWVCIIGVGLALARGYPQWGSVGPWVGAATYIIALGLFLAWRFASGKWKQIKLVEGGVSPAA